jgi:hypothetical protein
MKPQEFQQTLRQLLNREPFQPFVVELVDGRNLVVDHSKVLFGGGAASFFTPKHDLVEFACEDVQAMRLASDPPSQTPNPQSTSQAAQPKSERPKRFQKAARSQLD